jgi:hypothetical protein
MPEELKRRARGLTRRRPGRCGALNGTDTYTHGMSPTHANAHLAPSAALTDEIGKHLQASVEQIGQAPAWQKGGVNAQTNRKEFLWIPSTHLSIQPAQTNSQRSRIQRTKQDSTPGPSLKSRRRGAEMSRADFANHQGGKKKRSTKITQQKKEDDFQPAKDTQGGLQRMRSSFETSKESVSER